jgi:type IV pilus assembly protein PilQ
MTNAFSNSRKLFLLVIPLVILIAWFAGCASNKAGDVKAAGDKRITAITTQVTDDSVIVAIDGNQTLTYTAIKQVFPMGVLFHFPETALQEVKTVTTPPANEIIGSVKATELVEGKSTTSRIFIAMKADAPYELKPQDSGLQVIFPKGASPTPAAAAPVTEEPIAVQAAPTKTLPVASRLESVTATPLKNNVVINLQADGTIKNYKSFTIDGKEPRIVFDIFKIKSPFEKEQRIAVQSKWARQIRHFGYPDKVRLVVDTQNTYLDKYSASPTDNGLLIHVGNNLPAAAPSDSPAALADQKDQPMIAQAAKPAEKEKAPETKAVAAVEAGKPAWVNRIDFSSEEAGKSSLIIGTTAPIKYDLKKAADKRLHLTLFNTSLPDYRKRALITTRFESAVDRITPLQTSDMKGDSLFTIELREDVPYFVVQEEDTLRINFAPSSIPPKPYEDADLPEWKKVLAEATGELPKKAETDKVAEAKPGEKKPAEKKEAVELKTLSLEERLEEIAPEKKYTGEKIALDFYDTDIKNVFRILREISGKNFAIDKNVTGKVTLTLEKPVPWDQVLDLVLKMNQLGMTMEGDIVRIATLATLAQEEKLKQAQLKAAEAAQKQAEALEPLFTEYIPVSYSNAKNEILPHLTPILTEGRGKANVDERNNQIIITDTALKIKQAKQIVEKIDTVTAQVIIEARIVEANTNFSRDIGFDWGNVTLGAVDIPGTDWEFGPTSFTADNVPALFPSTGSLTFNLFKTSGTAFSIVEAQLAASEIEGKTNIISSPKIVTLDNKKAKIKQGFEYPYEERDSSGNATVRFKDIDLLLEVTPTVTPDNRISLTIFVTKNEIARETSLGPALSTNEAQTEILVDDGDTIVIGGILKSTIVWGERGIPGLRKMGVLGWLFKFQSESDEKNELLIFMTPRIVKLEQKRLS